MTEKKELKTTLLTRLRKKAVNPLMLSLMLMAGCFGKKDKNDYPKSFEEVCEKIGDIRSAEIVGGVDGSRSVKFRQSLGFFVYEYKDKSLDEITRVAMGNQGSLDGFGFMEITRDGGTICRRTDSKGAWKSCGSLTQDELNILYGKAKGNLVDRTKSVINRGFDNDGLHELFTMERIKEARGRK